MVTRGGHLRLKMAGKQKMRKCRGKCRPQLGTELKMAATIAQREVRGTLS